MRKRMLRSVLATVFSATVVFGAASALDPALGSVTAAAVPPPDSGWDSTPTDSGWNSAALDSGWNSAALDSGWNSAPMDSGWNSAPAGAAA